MHQLSPSRERYRRALGESTGDTQSLSHKTFNAAQWRLASVVGGGVLELAVGIVLARLLPPEDFGLLALALLFVGFTRLFSNLGLAPAVIQRDKLSERHVRVAFTLSVILGVGASSLLFLLAPLILLIFTEPSLPAILRVVSVAFALTGLGNTAGALLHRIMDFKTHFVISISSSIAYALLAVSFAVQGMGVWSLVGGYLAQRAVETCLLLYAVRHPLAPLLSERETKELTGFGLGATVGQVMSFLGRNGDNFVIGRWLGSESLGLYSRAYGLMMLPHDYLGQILNSVLFPALARIQSDRIRLRRTYVAAIQLMSLVTTPLMSGMLIAAPHLILGLYGPRWASSIVPLQVLCAVGVLRAISPVGETVGYATGRPYQVAGRIAVFAVIVVAACLRGTQWGITGVAVALGGAVLYLYLSVSSLTLRYVGLPWRRFLRAQVPGLVVGGAVGSAALVARLALESVSAPNLITFALILITCAIVYPSSLYALPLFFRPLELTDQIREPIQRLPQPLRTWICVILRLTSQHERPNFEPTTRSD